MQTGLFKTSIKGNNYRQLTKSFDPTLESPTPDQFGQAIALWAKQNLARDIHVLSLFSGAGGLDIGFHEAGFNVAECIELDAKFIKSLDANKKQGKYLTNTHIICTDIREYEPKPSKKIDFVIGGPPCQSFSKAGIRAAGVRGTKDSRGTLFEEYVRILDTLKPKGFLFENVSGILSAEKGETMAKITQAFEELGYTLSYRLLDAADYGVPQNRERLILVGTKNLSFRFPSPTHGVDSSDQHSYFSAQQALHEIPDEEGDLSAGLGGKFGHLLDGVPPGLNYSFYTEKMGHPQPVFAWRSKFSDYLYKADPELPVRTLKASGGQYTGPFHWDNRSFTSKELKRLQTFPDNYVIEGGKRIVAKQIGNSVPPQFARILALNVLDQVFKINLPYRFNYLLPSDQLSFKKVKSARTKHYAKKAREAIDALQPKANTETQARKYYGTLKGLNILEVASGKNGQEIKFDATGNFWHLSIPSGNKHLYTIEITSNTSQYLFNATKGIKLEGYEWSLDHYLLLWKAFEKELIDNEIRADLVQLNGYYQYDPLLKLGLDFHYFDSIPDNLIDTWLCMSALFNDSLHAELRHIEDISLAYDIGVERLIDAMKGLKNIGYEIRNHKTNPEIPKDHYLLPYKFPSQNNLSLQLKTSL